MAETATAADAAVTRYPEIETDLIESSGLNPRTHWNDVDDKELQDSIRMDGVLEPIIVRPHPTKLRHFQIVAGERRFRAAAAIGLGLVPAIVRDVTDEKLLELALTENIQRRSMHPLDEANGFVHRLEMGGTTPEGLANSLGLSKRYVTDRIRLKKLSAKATKMLEAGDMTVSHAIVLARLDLKLQDEAIHDNVNHTLDGFGSSSREVMRPLDDLKHWIADNVPLDPKSPETQAEFPEIVEASTEAAAKGATVVMLSMHRTPWQHKAKPDDPLFSDKWQECKKSDKAAQIGVVVEGHRRGERVYFKPPTPVKRETSTSGSSSGLTPAEKKRRDAQVKRDQADARRRREQQQLWAANKTKAFEAFSAHVATAPIKRVITALARNWGKPSAETADAFVRGAVVNGAKNSLHSVEGFDYSAKHVGFDVKAWLKQQKPAAPAPAKAAKKAKKR